MFGNRHHALSGDAGFRVWPDASGTNAAPLLVCGRTATNGVNGVSFLSGDDSDLFVEAVSNGTATLKYSYTGTGDAAGLSCSASLKMTAWGIEFVHAEGDYAGQPMDELPVFTPCSGTGKGVPIYDSPNADLTVSFTSTNALGIRSATVTYLGNLFAVTETDQGSRLFTNAMIAASVSDTMLADANVQEWLSISLDMPTLGITNAVYTCAETSADSSVFENVRYGLVFSTSAPYDTNRVAGLYLVTESLADDMALVETAAGASVFTNGNMTVRLLEIAGHPRLSVSDGVALSSAIFSVWETAPLSYCYRNYNEPVATDLSNTPVPDFVPWRLKIYGFSDPSLISRVSITTSVDSASQITFSASGGNLFSDQKFILTPNRTFDASLPSGYAPLVTDTQSADWKTVAARTVVAEIQLAMMSRPANRVTKRSEDAMVLQSLDMGGFERLATGLDPEEKIRAPVLAMGYSAVRNYKASKADALAEVKGKQVWYSMSHSQLAVNLPNNTVSFAGLRFKNDERIRTVDLTGSDLDYKLVMVDGCCSAMTERLDKFCVMLGAMYNGPEKLAARNNNNLVDECVDFADAFGRDSAYVGWAWVMNPATAQGWMSAFLHNLKGGNTVQQAHAKFIDDNEGASQDVRLMKIYGSTQNVIDKAKEESN